MPLLSPASWANSLRFLYRKIRRRALQVDRSRIELKPLRETDVAVLDRLGPASPEGSYAKDWARQRSGEITVLVAWYGRRPMGVGLVHWAGPRQAAVQAIYPGCPEIFRLHVRPHYRSMGLGTLLIDEFERMARARGCPSIGLGVTYENPGALALYQRLGYGEPAPSDFLDEFDTLQPDGQVTHHSIKAHFLVKRL